MFCSKCGTKNEDGTRFCMKCGNRMAVPTSETECTPIAQPIRETPIEQTTVCEPVQEEFSFKLLQQEPLSKPVQEAPEPVREAVEQEAPPYTPVQGAYAPLPAQHYQPQNPPPQRKKKTMLPWVILGAVLVLIGSAAVAYFTGALNSLLGKEEPKKEDISGYYVLQSAVIHGEELEESALEWRDYALFLQLNADNTAVFFNGDVLVDCTYQNGELKPSEGGSMAYRVEGDTLSLTTAEGEMIFQKNDAQMPDRTQLEQLLAVPQEVGYFKLLFAAEGTRTYTSKDFGGNEVFLLFYEDGTGVFCTNEVMDMRWADGVTYPVGHEDSPAKYTVKGDTFTMNVDGIEFTFERSDETPPDIEALRRELKPSFVGYFIMTEMSKDGKTIRIADLEQEYESLGVPMPFLLIEEDGSGVLFSGTSLQDMQWDEDGIWPKGNEAEKLPYDLQGNALTIENESVRMSFERSFETEPDVQALRERLEKPDEPTPSDVDLTGEYELYAYDMGNGKQDSTGATLSLKSDGTGTYAFGSGSLDVTWSSTYLTVGTVQYTYEVDEEKNITMSGVDGIFYFRPINSEYQRWAGEWYGFWMISECTGDMEEYDNMWWDLCARSTVDGNGVITMSFWDEDSKDLDDPIGEGEFEIVNDEHLKSIEGWFYTAEFADEITDYPEQNFSDDMIVLEGTHTDENGSYTYTLYLRPWGTKWDDVEEELWPYYYKQWYLPLVEAGEGIPDVFNFPKE